jgi:hypothetical protein
MMQNLHIQIKSVLFTELNFYIFVKKIKPYFWRVKKIMIYDGYRGRSEFF